MARESSQPGLSDQVGRPRLPEGVCEHEVDGLGGAAAGRGDDVDGHVHGHRPGGGGGGGREGTGELPVSVEEEHAEEGDSEGEVERVLGQHDASNQEGHAGDGRFNSEGQTDGKFTQKTVDTKCFFLNILVFFFNWNPLISPTTKSVYNLGHLEVFWSR